MKDTIIRSLIETASRQTPDMPIAQIKKWAEDRFDLFEKTLGIDEAINRLFAKSRYGSLIGQITKILSPVSGEWVYDEKDEGFRRVKNGIDPVSWLNEKIAEGMTDTQIMQAATESVK